MNTFITKTGKISSLTIAVLLGIGLTAGEVSAQESLVKGSNTTVDDAIIGTAPDQLVATTVTLPLNSGVWNCAVTGSAEAINPLNNDDNRYIFGFSEAAGVAAVLPAFTQSGGDRTIDFDNLTGEEINLEVVSSTYVFTGLSTLVNANTHTFYWSARKENGLDTNMTVNDSSMSVICSDFP